MKKVTETVRELALPVVEENGCKLWDVEYVREAGQWYLRIYIDKDDGVNILDCEAISRALSDILDEADPIESSYIFEVAPMIAIQITDFFLLRRSFRGRVRRRGAPAQAAR